MRGLTEFGIKRDRLTILFIIFIIFYGIFTYIIHPVQEDPTIPVRQARVFALFPGMSTDRVEQLITVKLEEILREIPELEKITSSSKTGLSVIQVSIRESISELGPIWQRVRNKVNDIKTELPIGTIGPFVNDDFGSVVEVSLALTGDGYSLADLYRQAKDIRVQLYKIPSLGRIELHGELEERVYVEANDARLARYGINPQSLISSMQQQNIILPGGIVQTDTLNIAIEPTGSFATVDDIANVPIQLPNTEKIIPLSEMATITRDFIDPPETIVLYNGKPAIIIALTMTEGDNVIKFGKAVDEKIKLIKQGLPYGMNIDVATFQPKLVKDSIQDFSTNLYQTLIVVLGVSILVLGFRTGIIVGSIVPLTILLSIIIMYAFNIELQRVTIASLIIALGLLIDNGIVVVEDIRRRIDHGEEKIAASIAAGNELSIPLLVSSLTTIFAFMPLALAASQAGDYSRSLFYVITITLLCSWLLAVYVTPLVSVWFMKPAKKKVEFPHYARLQNAYRKIIISVLNHRVIVIILLVFILSGAILLFQFIPQKFFPDSDRPQLLINLDLGNGVGIKKNAEQVKSIVEWLNDKSINPQLERISSYIGYGGIRFYLVLDPREPEQSESLIIVNLSRDADVNKKIKDIQHYIDENMPLVDADVQPLKLGTSETGFLRIRISGDEVSVLHNLAFQVESILKGISGVKKVKNDWGNKSLKVVVDIDQNKLKLANLTSQDVANSLNSFISGLDITPFRENDENIPILLRGIDTERISLDRIRTISIYSSQLGTSVPLIQVASIRPELTYSDIKRRNLERTITVSAQSDQYTINKLYSIVSDKIKDVEFPYGYSWEVGGEIEEAQRANDSLFKFLPLAIILIIVLFVWQFNSFLRATIIFISIPIALIGSFYGLLINGAEFGFMATLGLLSLAGIIVNHGVILMEAINEQEAIIDSPYEALLSACVKRVRPILLTTLTTCIGLLPLMVFGGPLWYGMTTVIFYGLLIGTAVTLIISPVFYSYFFKVKIES